MNGSDKYKCVGSVILIPCEKIDSNPYYSEKAYNSPMFDELVASIKSNGIIQPLMVKKQYNRYQLISGERRLRAAVASGMIYVPCIVMNISDLQIAEFSLIENLQRKDLHFFDEAKAIFDIMDKYNVSFEQLSFTVGKSVRYLKEKVSLLKLSDNVRDYIRKSDLSEYHAMSLLRINDTDKQMQAVKHFIDNDTDKNETESYINALLSPDKLIIKAKIIKLGDIKIFINTLNHSVDTMQKAGIEAVSYQHESNDYFEYVIRIPKLTTSPVRQSEYIGSA